MVYEMMKGADNGILGASCVTVSAHFIADTQSLAAVCVMGKGRFAADGEAGGGFRLLSTDKLPQPVGTGTAGETKPGWGTQNAVSAFEYTISDSDQPPSTYSAHFNNGRFHVTAYRQGGNTGH